MHRADCGNGSRKAFGVATAQPAGVTSLVYVVDDDLSVRRSLQRLLESSGFLVQTFKSGQEFLRHADRKAAGCLILDVVMPELSGLELQQELLARGYEVPIIFITAHDSATARQNALSAGAHAFLRKPFEDLVLLNAIYLAFESAA